jgi:hypothetical protein
MFATAAALVLLAVIAGALLWGAAEQHYRGCLEQRFVSGAGGSRGLGGSVFKPRPLQPVSTEGCDRWPF